MRQDDPKLRQARQHINAGRLDQARALLQRHLQAQPGDAAACSMMAYIVSHTGDAARGVYYARRACELEPENMEYRCVLGAALETAKQAGEAIDVFRDCACEG
jgi:predicted Zn-dependent protease